MHTLRSVATLLALAAGCSTPAATPAAHPGQHSHDHGHHHGHAAHGKQHGPLVHRFERAEDWVDRFEGPERDAWQKPAHVVEVMQLAEGMTVADLGAGTGYFLPHLSAAVGASGKVLGLDVEPDMVRYMNERAARESLANVEAKQVPIDSPGLPEASADRILIVDTWHHIPDRTEYAAKLAAALGASGAIYVVDFTMESDIGPPPRHRILPQQVMDELTSAGLHAELVQEQLDKQYIVRASKPDA